MAAPLDDYHASAPLTRFGHVLTEHTLSVPWDHHHPQPHGADRLTIFARSITRPDDDSSPWLVYLQGGPGFPAPRPLDTGGWLGEALQHYRVLLLDQRGTGRSSRIDGASLANFGDVDAQARHLSLLRADQIVADCEAFRAVLSPDQPWSLFGQSFGGFCITSYLSLYPAGVKEAYFTGGLPSLDLTAEELYRATFAKLRIRHERFYRQIPFAEDRLRHICHHLDNTAEFLPTGERLSSRRLRTLGINLGRGTGFDTLAYLLADPFHIVGGEKRLRSDFLGAVGAQVSFADGPLYAAIHESIYAGATAAVAGQATNWAAHRVREEVPGFSEHADPRDRSEPFYLTGEHIFPWQFAEDPSLRPFAAVAEQLAQRKDWPALYDRTQLAAITAPTAAAIYVDDIFVPFEGSLALSELLGNNRPYITNLFEHDGIRAGGQEIFAQLRHLIADH